MSDGFYYLHENNALIYKSNTDSICDARDSDLVKAIWVMDSKNREVAWSLLVEALSLKADKKKIDDLAKRWRCTDEDALVYADRIGVVLSIDGDAKCAKPIKFTDLQSDVAGFGNNYLEAMAELCNELGYSGGKMNWHFSFKQLIENVNKEQK